MLPTHAVGIDLGTTYSCISYLNEHGEPITIPNRDGELSTPSVVLFDGGQVIVGTEALRNSIRHPDKVVVHAKRYMGNPAHRWKIDGRSYSPIDISTLILKSMLESAQEKIGKIEQAVITVPAQFSDVQRQATAEAGKRAGLKHVDIINEPVAAALCFVLGTEGLWFTDIANDQTIMVVDLGGGTFDLSMVRYKKNEVRVIASGGDLHLGGLDWNRALEIAISKQFQKEFNIDPMKEREAAQALALEAEQTKRSLSVRPKAAMTCAASGQRKTYQVEQEQFERLTKELVERMERLTLDLLKEHNMGWAKIDVVLTTGGSSRMPMVRNLFKKLSGRTLNTSLSPDQSIAHGATYYAGMLLTNNSFAKSVLNPTAAARLAQFKQQSATARSLGILIRDVASQTRVPHYILPANTPLPASVSQIYGTVSNNQRRVHLRIVESGTAADSAYVELGTCMVEPLPENLPEGTEIEVTIRYDEQARVHVEGKVLKTGQVAKTEIVRPENMVVNTLSEGAETSDDDPLSEAALKSVSLASGGTPSGTRLSSPSRTAAPQRPVQKSDSSSDMPVPVSSRPSVGPKPVPIPKGVGTPGVRPTPTGRSKLDDSALPVPLCNQCGEPLDQRGQCPACKTRSSNKSPLSQPGKPQPGRAAQSGVFKSSGMALPPLPDDDDIIELEETAATRRAAAKPTPSAARPTPGKTPAATTPATSKSPAVKPAAGAKPPAVKSPPLAGPPKVKAPPLPPAAGLAKPKPTTKPKSGKDNVDDDF